MVSVVVCLFVCVVVVVIIIIVVAVVVHPRNLTLLFGWHRVINSRVIADIEFGWWWVVDLSHFRVTPNFWVELRLSWGCDNELLIMKRWDWKTEWFSGSGWETETKKTKTYTLYKIYLEQLYQSLIYLVGLFLFLVTLCSIECLWSSYFPTDNITGLLWLRNNGIGTRIKTIYL